MDERLRERLREWHEAGLIDAATAVALEAFEAQRPAPASLGPPAVGSDRPSASEVLVDAGFAVVVAGILYGIFTGLGSAAGPVVLLFAACSAGLAGALAREGTVPARRGAGAALALAAALAGLGVGTVLVNAGAFTSTRVVGSSPYAYTVTEHNQAALAAIAAGVTLLLALGALEVLVTGLLALLVAAAAEAAAFTSASALGGEALHRTGAPALAAAAFLVLLAARPRLARVSAVLSFSALLVAPLALLAVGGIEGAPTWALIVLAGLIATGSMAAAVRLGSNPLALAGGIGILAVAIDVTGRTLGSSAGAPVVLIVSGLLLVACAVLTQQAMRRARARRPT